MCNGTPFTVEKISPRVRIELGHLVYQSETILAILVGSHLGNIPMKFESHWPKGSGGVSF